jgi:hypothetical protein
MSSSLLYGGILHKGRKKTPSRRMQDAHVPRRVCKDTTRSISIILVWHNLGGHPFASFQSVRNQ